MPISFRREPAPPTTRSIVVDGRQLRIDVRPGTGRQPPLLLVNGVGASLGVVVGKGRHLAWAVPLDRRGSSCVQPGPA